MPRHLVFRFPSRLAAWVVALCAFLGAMAVPASAHAAILYTDFDAWQAAAGETIHTKYFGPYPSKFINDLTLDGGAKLEFSEQTRIIQDGLPWGGDSHGLLAPIGGSEAYTISFLDNAAALGFWVNPVGDSVHLSFAGIDQSISIPTRTTQFIGWVGQDMSAITITTSDVADYTNFFFGDFYEGAGATPVPEPAPLLLLGLGWLAWLGARKRRPA